MSQVEKNALDDFMKDVFPNFPIPSDPRDEIISTTLGSAPDPIVETFKLVRRTDPLVLDLDGDGFESTALSQGVLFDANGDGIRTGTAWFKADEGIVALDRNGNGVIDSGLELFGDETLLADGRPAPHGFAALAELDTGHVDPNAPVPGTRVGAGDGVIDAQDEGFANLRIWRDLNQDGVSQSAELQTLAESGVASIRAASQSVGIDYGDARLVQDGLFTRADGSQGQAGSFVLAQNFFTRAFTPIAQSADAQALPPVTGTGWVRDLREAATQDPHLVALFQQGDSAQTRGEFRQAVSDLLLQWGSHSAYVSASDKALQLGYGLILSEPQNAQERGWMAAAIKWDAPARESFRANLSSADQGAFDAMRERMVGALEKIYVYEAMTGTTFANWEKIYHDAFPATTLVTGDSGGVAVWTKEPWSFLWGRDKVGTPSTQEGYIRVSPPLANTGDVVGPMWTRLLDDATANLMDTMRLDDYLDKVTLNVSGGQVNFDFTQMNAAVTAAGATHAYEDALLVADLMRAHGESLTQLGWNGVTQMRGYAQQAGSDTALRDALAVRIAGTSAAITFTSFWTGVDPVSDKRRHRRAAQPPGGGAGLQATGAGFRRRPRGQRPGGCGLDALRDPSVHRAGARLMVGQPAAGLSEPLDCAATACGRGRRSAHPHPGRVGGAGAHGRAGLAGQCDGCIAGGAGCGGGVDVRLSGAGCAEIL